MKMINSAIARNADNRKKAQLSYKLDFRSLILGDKGRREDI